MSDLIPPILSKIYHRLTEDPSFRQNRIDRVERIDSFWKSHGGKAHEDLFIDLLFRSKEKGVYVEIGANDPATTTSYVQMFYERGWRGINIEPGRKEFESMKKFRPEDINLDICIGGETGTMPFYEIADSQASSLKKNFAEKQGHVSSARNVEVWTLKHLFDTYALPEIDFVVIDAEGMEFEILKSNDWGKYRPKAMIIETVHHDFKNIKNYLRSLEYLDVYTNYLNTIFIDREYFKNDSRFDVRDERKQNIQK